MSPWVLLLVLLALGGRKSGKTAPGALAGGGNGSKPAKPGFKPAPTGPRPPGMPPGGCNFSPKLFPSAEAVKAAFAALGYPVPADRVTMNKLGPNGVLGGGDDEPSESVLAFQLHYNQASYEKLLGPDAGGLDPDGFVGPCVLSAIQHVLSMMPANEWQTRVELAYG